ncbi:hypothetical protein BCT47_21620 [Vibrio splendidus]|uniref:Uncharacterized protein n=1 Tax=Vibrio splendidus TaxID=29497 RepID=A0AB35N326_VIBSP|nr:hypothetical protein [Vibrio splendidus]MDP2502888.1 hypothetical protein [Vibrio splendidus]PMM74392.1 hypothetical protein BCT47_21620 [Vibrio splendidus]PTO83285.1 hypothetical protein CWN93_08660 [Vibrio splendidus]
MAISDKEIREKRKESWDASKEQANEAYQNDSLEQYLSELSPDTAGSGNVLIRMNPWMYGALLQMMQERDIKPRLSKSFQRNTTTIQEFILQLIEEEHERTRTK